MIGFVFQVILLLSVMGFVFRGYSITLSEDLVINCRIPPAHCMLGLLACSEAYEFGQLGTGLSWFR